MYRFGHSSFLIIIRPNNNIRFLSPLCAVTDTIISAVFWPKLTGSDSSTSLLTSPKTSIPPPLFFPLSLYPPFQVPFDRFTCHASSTLSISIQKTVLRILNQSFPTNTCFANIFSPVTFSMSTLFGNEHLRFCRNLNCDDCCLMKR